MAAPLALVWELIARDNASATFDRVGDSAAVNAEKTAAFTGGLAKISEAIGLAGVAVAAVSLKMAADYQSTTTKLVTTAGESKDAIGMVSQGMLDMSTHVGISAQKLAEGMYIVESAGYHGAEALNVLKASAEGAAQEHASLEHVADAVSTALHDYHLPASDAADVTSKLITAVSHGKTNFDEFTASLHSVTPIASAAHINLADVTGVLSSMTASGMSAQQAAQNLGSTIKRFSGGGLTQPMIQELGAVGISAQDLVNNLGDGPGKTGLAATLQKVSTAILEHMGPAGTVLLSTMNQSTQAGHDAGRMFDALPPAAQKVAKAITENTEAYAAFRKTGSGLDVEQRTQVVQWAALHDKAVGFSQALKSGSADSQNYVAALAKATGGQEALSVMLQTTGENATATNATIQDISGSTAQADGNIKGWDEVLGTFNLQLANVINTMKKWLIELGEKFLPKATEFLLWLQSSAKWLEQHTELLKHVALTVGELTAAYLTFSTTMKAVNLVTTAWKALLEESPVVRFAVVIGTVSAAFLTLYNTNKTFHDFFQGAVVPALHGGEVVLQGVAAAVGDVAKFFGSLPGPLQAAVGGLVAFKVASTVLSGVMTSTTSSVKGFMSTIGNSTAINAMGVSYLDASEKASTFARTQGVLAAAGAGVRTGISGIMGALGGPWGLAIAGATAVLSIFIGKQQEEQRATEAAKAATQDWNRAFIESHGAIDQSIRDKAALQATDAKLIQGTKEFGSSAKNTVDAVLGLGSSYDDLRKHLEDVVKAETSAANDDSGMTFVSDLGKRAEAQLKVLDQLHGATTSGAADAKTYASASDLAAASQAKLKDAQKNLNDAMDEGANKFQILNKGALDQSTASDALEKAYNSLTDSVHQNGTVIDGNTSAALSNRDAVKTAIQALQDKVNSDYQANLSTMTLTEAQQKAKEETDQGKEALIRIAGQLGITGQAFNDLTGTIHAVPTQHDIDVTNNALASQQAIDLLSSSIHTIPAQTKIAIDIAAGQQLNNAAGFTSGPNADGNIYSAFADGGVENHVAQIAGKSGHGRLWAEDETGGESYIPLSPHKRERSLDIWHQTGELLGAFADGGITSGVDINVVTDLSKAMAAVKAETSARQLAASGGPPGSMPSGDLAGWIATALSILGKDYGTFAPGLSTLIGFESGGNPNAINLTDSNAMAGHPSKGLTQTIDSTFNAYALPGYGNIYGPVDNIIAGFRYAEATYGDGMLASGGRRDSSGGYLGYDRGGLLMPGFSQVYNGHSEPEIITPPGAGQFGGGKDVTINVYSLPGQSGEQIALEVKRQLLFEMR